MASCNNDQDKSGTSIQLTRDVLCLSQIRSILDEMQRSTKYYGVGSGAKHVDERNKEILDLFKQVKTEALLNAEILIVTYGGDGCKYNTTWRLFQKMQEMRISEMDGTSISKPSTYQWDAMEGIFKGLILCNVETNKYTVNVSMIGWDGSIPGERLDSRNPTGGWNQSVIMFLDKLIEYANTIKCDTCSC
tara:strand:- start:177 stop:746 length:570 start_codon:yes stop_codon:yes gene_type:complete